MNPTPSHIQTSKLYSTAVVTKKMPSIYGDLQFAKLKKVQGNLRFEIVKTRESKGQFEI